uniref:Putative WD repeat-containing protein C2A9.03 n=1 Tax=Noccaea caerulescens TaxID=107243 RepID=A0A1J3F2B0_NOCCA
MTCEENAITNAVDIHRNSSGVRNFDMERFQLVQHFHYPWPVNRSSVSPDGKLVAIVGDDPDGLLVDSNNGETVGKLNGHLDYSFASAWHPNGVTFATGNQDKTCRVWDVRNLSKSVAVLKGNLGAIRSIRFSSDGQYMAMAVYSKNCSAFMYFISIFFCSCNDLSIQKKKRDLS